MPRLTKMTVCKWTKMIFLWISLCGFGAKAIERVGYVGVGVSPVFYKTPQDSNVLSFTFQTGLFLTEQAAFTLNWRIDIKDQKTDAVETGLKYYFLKSREILPFVMVQGVFQSRPEKLFGWNAKAGVEWDLVRFTHINNLRLTVSSGTTHLINTEPDIVYFDYLQGTMSWHF